MKRKIRKDFDPTKEYSVDVLGSTKEEKEEVQQAFFDVGITWVRNGAVYKYLSAMQYTNKYDDGDISAHNLYVGTSNGSNMSAQEFLDLVYEPELQGHVHAELMAQYAEDAKSHIEPWKLWQLKSIPYDWTDCKLSPSWIPFIEYRRKPKTHFVHGVEIPDLRINPKEGQEYWYPDPNTDDLVIKSWHRNGLISQSHRAANNLCYEPTLEGKQAAILHAKAWLGV